MIYDYVISKPPLDDLFLMHFNKNHDKSNGQFTSGPGGSVSKSTTNNKKITSDDWDNMDDKTKEEYLENQVKNIKHPPLTDKPVMTIKTKDGRTWKSESEKSLYGWMNKDQIKQRDKMRIGWEMKGMSKDAIKYCETQFGGTFANVDDPELIELVVMEYEDATGKKAGKIKW